MGGVGNFALLSCESLLGRGEPLPAAAGRAPSAAALSATAEGCRSTVLDSGSALVLGLAEVAGHREARNSVGLAPQGVESLLALAVENTGERRSPPHPGRAQIAYPTHGIRECSMGPA